MSKLLSIFLIGGTICLTGCFSIEVAKEPGGHKTQIAASNYGWYLFDFIPLFCGDPDDDWIVPCTFFHNRVTMDVIQSKLLAEAHKRGMKVENLTWSNNDSVLLTIPLLQVPVPIPYLVTYREMQLSAEAKK